MATKQAARAYVKLVPKATAKTMARNTAMLKRVALMARAHQERCAKLHKKHEAGTLFVWERTEWMRRVDEATPVLERAHRKEAKRRNRSRVRKGLEKPYEGLRRTTVCRTTYTIHARFELVRTVDGQRLGHVHLPVDDEAFGMARWVAYGGDWKPVLGEGHLPSVAAAKRALLGVVVGADLLPVSVLTHGP